MRRTSRKVLEDLILLDEVHPQPQVIVQEAEEALGERRVRQLRQRARK